MKKGASLLLTLLIMSALIAIASGVAKISLKEIKLIRDIPKSLIAYYAAEAGAEWAIYEHRQNGSVFPVPDCSVRLDNNSSYGIEVDTGIIRSVGCYDNIRRAIEVSF